MKFCGRLHCLLQDTLPEWRDKFLSYKKLKKSLKLIPPSDSADADDSVDSTIACPHHSNAQSIAFCRRLIAEEAAFIQMLDNELEKVNSFFLDKEEEFVIRSQEVKARLEMLEEVHGLGSVNESIEMRMGICRDIVIIHGEMVLLINYSALNYVGFAKILKKHDKMTGRLLRSIYIQKVLQAPFFATDMLSNQVGEWEEILHTQFPTLSPPLHPNMQPSISKNPQEMMVLVDPSDPLASSSASSSASSASSLPSDLSISMDVVAPMREDDAAMYSTCKNIMAACKIMRELRRGSSTYNFFSFPPFGSYTFPDDHLDLCSEGLINPLTSSIQSSQFTLKLVSTFH